MLTQLYSIVLLNEEYPKAHYLVHLRAYIEHNYMIFHPLPLNQRKGDTFTLTSQPNILVNLQQL